MGAADAFSALHLPAMGLSGVHLGGVAGTLPLLPGITFGTINELIRNRYPESFLHGIGDWWPLFDDPGSIAWSKSR